MKRIVLILLFLSAVVWGWHTAGEVMAFAEIRTEQTQTACGEATPSVDSGIQVLKDANRYAEITAPPNTVPLNVSRRYRPAGFSFDKLFVYLTENQNTCANHTFKFFLEFSQGYAALLKETGYYIYTLRKIII